MRGEWGPPAAGCLGGQGARDGDTVIPGAEVMLGGTRRFSRAEDDPRGYEVILEGVRGVIPQ